MGGSSFEHIAEAIIQQQRLMDALEIENRELRHQLADLQTGHSVFIEINGTRFALGDAPAASSTPTASPATEIVATPRTPLTPRTTTILSADLPATPVAEIAQQQPAETLPVTEVKTATPSTFLEEIMIDEFSSALTSPMSVWQGPTRKPATSEEDARKASLRQELMGSYLLE